MGRLHHKHLCCGTSQQSQHQIHHIQHQFRWLGHVSRMKESRLPWQILYSELTTGNRPRGCPFLHCKDQFKQMLKLTKIDINSWENEAQNPNSWHHSFSTGTQQFEAEWWWIVKAKIWERNQRLSQPRPHQSHASFVTECSMQEVDSQATNATTTITEGKSHEGIPILLYENKPPFF